MVTPAADADRTIARRLHGEPEDSSELTEATHWSRVYAELVVGFRSIANGEARTHRRSRDIQVERLEHRFAFWNRRRRELTRAAEPAHSPDSNP